MQLLTELTRSAMAIAALIIIDSIIFAFGTCKIEMCSRGNLLLIIYQYLLLGC